MAEKQALILVTNDDGVSAKGIASLFEVVHGMGQVVLIAPDSPQSGMGHAITINDPLRLYPSTLFEEIDAMACSGTPVDCVKLGMSALLLDEAFSRLDAGRRAQVRSFVFDRAKAKNLPVLMVTHDADDAEAAGGHVISLASATPHDVAP